MRFTSLFRSSHSHVTSSPYAKVTGDDTEREGDGRGLLVRARASETQAHPACDTTSHALRTGPWQPHEIKTPGAELFALQCHYLFAFQIRALQIDEVTAKPITWVLLEPIITLASPGSKLHCQEAQVFLPLAPPCKAS